MEVGMKVLIISDDKQVIQDIGFCLRIKYADIEVIINNKVNESLDLLEFQSPHLVILDSTLSNISSIDVIENIREFSDVPLVILSEMETDMDRARGLEAGADEYITKPFSPLELLARVRALLRRTQGLGFQQGHADAILLSRALSIDFGTHEVFLSGERVKLTPIEYHLLKELVRNEGRVLTHRVILEKVWGSEYGNESSFIKKYIYRLRSKLENDASKPQMLLTERGIGYRFVRSI